MDGLIHPLKSAKILHIFCTYYETTLAIVMVCVCVIIECMKGKKRRWFGLWWSTKRMKGWRGCPRWWPGGGCGWTMDMVWWWYARCNTGAAVFWEEDGTGYVTSALVYKGMTLVTTLVSLVSSFVDFFLDFFWLFFLIFLTFFDFFLTLFNFSLKFNYIIFLKFNCIFFLHS